MNKIMFSGRIRKSEFFPATQERRAYVKIIISMTRKGKEVDAEFIGFSPVSEFVGKGLRILPIDDKGTLIPPERACFGPGCRIEGFAYLDDDSYTDKNGVFRLKNCLVLEEVQSEPLDQEGARWLQSKQETRWNQPNHQVQSRPQAQAQRQPQGVQNARPQTVQAQIQRPLQGVQNARPQMSPQAQAQRQPQGMQNARPQMSPQAQAQRQPQGMQNAQPQMSPQAQAQRQPQGVQNAQPQTVQAQAQNRPQGAQNVQPQMSPQAQAQRPPQGMQNVQPQMSPQAQTQRPSQGVQNARPQTVQAQVQQQVQATPAPGRKLPPKYEDKKSAGGFSPGILPGIPQGGFRPSSIPAETRQEGGTAKMPNPSGK